MVELCRFLACYVIFSYHAGGRFTTGWIFVEFFFMLSGYFAIKHLVRMEGKIENKATYPIQYTIDKFKRLLPYTTVGFVADCIISAWKYQFTGMKLVKWILYLPVNLFYLAGTGMMPADVPISDTVWTSYIMGGALWYICAMFVAMPVMMYLYLYLGKKIGPWLISFLPMLLYGYLIICDGTVNGWHADHGAFLAVDLRALAGMLAGGLIYVLSERIRRYRYKPAGTALLTLAELSLLAFVLCFACTSGFSQDGLLIGCFILLLSLMLSGKSLTARIQLQPLIWLGTLSLPIYCIHEAVIISFWGYEIEKRNMFLIIFVAALILHLMVKLGKPLFGALGRGLKKLCCYPEQNA